MAGADLSGTDGNELPDMSKTPSGLSAGGTLESLQADTTPDGTKVPAPGGPTVHLDDSPEMDFTGIVDNAAGTFKMPIASTDVGGEHYFIVEGPADTSNGMDILRTWIAPKKLIDGGSANNALVLHYFDNRGDGTDIQSVLGKELAAQGDIASATDIGKKYSFAYGPISYISDSGFTNYTHYSIQVTDGGTALDNTQCGKPLNQCCVYYTTADFGSYSGGAVSSFIDYGQQVARGTLNLNIYPYFVVVCPAVAGKAEGELAGEIVLKQTQPTNMLLGSDGNPPPSDPNDITCPGCGVTVPKVLNNGVHVEWWIR